MKQDILTKLRKDIFFNNICAIVCIFCSLCFLTSDCLEHSAIKKQNYTISQNNMIGPIVIDKNSAIYKIKAYFNGKNSSEYLSVEVLDENKDTIYEFGKDFWHEEGYDSGEYWSDSVKEMNAYLTFSEKGRYYLLFNTEGKNLNKILITIYRLNSSYIPHFAIGTIFLILLLIFWLSKNWTWFKEGTERFCYKHFDTSPAGIIGMFILAAIIVWIERL